MIRLQDYTPEVYYKQSRDFQFIGRLYDIVLNSVKTNSDLLYNLRNSDNLNKNLVDLLVLTVGFKPKHKYTTKQLLAICKIFPILLKYKGSIKSIILAVETILHAEGITQNFSYILESEQHNIKLFVTQSLIDINLLKDILDYIIPAGMSYEIIKAEITWKGKVNTLVAKVSTNAKNTAILNAGVITDIPYPADNLRKNFTGFNASNAIGNGTITSQLPNLIKK